MATLSNLSSAIDSNYFDLHKVGQSIPLTNVLGNIKFSAQNNTFVDIGYPYSETDRTGPLIAFRSVNYANAPGNMSLFIPTTDKSSYYTLDLYHTGALKWRNQEVVRLKESYRNGSTWYRVYDDGTIMQGGICYTTQYNNTSMNVTFPKAFSNTNYIAIANPNTPNHQETWTIDGRCAVKKTTGMSVHGGQNGNGAYTGTSSWLAIGT